MVRLIDSTVTGNGEVGLPMDIATDRLPKLLNTTCGRSAVAVDGTVYTDQTWHVCAND